MARLYSTEPMSLLHRHRPRPRSSLVAAFAAATKRARAGTLRPEDAHHLFDELLRHDATPVPERSLRGSLAAFARAPASDACTDGASLAVALFSRVHAGRQVAAFTDHTYCLLIECCCRARRPDLALAFSGRFLRTGLKTSSDELVASTLRRCLPLSSASPPTASWSPIAALSAATERARAGKLSSEDAHHLFDELLRQSNPVPLPFLNAFLAALARAPTRREGPALAVALFTRVHREDGGLAPLSVHTYNTIMDCCCRARRPDLGLAIFGRLLQTGLKTDQITANAFLKCLCYTKRTDEAVSTLLHRMSELGCAPDAFSYSFVLKGLCDVGRSQQALGLLLQTAAKQGGASCSLDVVTYNTVIHGLCNEGQVSKARDLFHGMMRRRVVVPDAVTYSMIIQGLLKEGEVGKAESVMRQMADEGVRPDKVAYYSMIHGYSSLGRTKEAGKMFGEMKTRRRPRPNR